MVVATDVDVDRSRSADDRKEVAGATGITVEARAETFGDGDVPIEQGPPALKDRFLFRRERLIRPAKITRGRNGSTRRQQAVAPFRRSVEGFEKGDYLVLVCRVECGVRVTCGGPLTTVQADCRVERIRAAIVEIRSDCPDAPERLGAEL